MCPVSGEASAPADTAGGMADEAAPAHFEIAPGLPVRQAGEVASALLAWLDARPGDGVLDLAPGDMPPSPTALQLLVAATRSGAHSPPPLGPRAAAAVAALDLLAPHDTASGHW